MELNETFEIKTKCLKRQKFEKKNSIDLINDHHFIKSSKSMMTAKKKTFSFFSILTIAIFFLMPISFSRAPTKGCDLFHCNL